MFAEERQEKIFRIVNERTSVKVSELSEELEISEVTIRRDLDELQRQNRVIRTHGGAMSTYNVGKPILSSYLMSRETTQKKRIAEVAYTMIKEYDTILLDTSSTVNELVKLIADGPKKNLRVITTSIMAVQTLANTSNCTVQIVGGEVNYTHQTVEGSAACRFIKDIRVDKCFIGINGIDEKFGFSTPRYADADTKNAMIQVAHCSFVLADYTKIGKTYLTKIDAPDYLISDQPVNGFDYENLAPTTTVIFANDRFREDIEE